MKKTALKTILCLMTTLIMIVPTFASTKSYDLEINKEYQSVTITTTVPDDEYIYSMTVKSPDGKTVYEATEEDGVIKRQISDVLKEGKWKVEIEKYTLDEEGNKIAASNPVNGIDIVFKGNTEKSANVDDNVFVAADIIGFKYYMIDDQLVIKWTDENCGNVNIEVVNEANNQTIGKEVVETRATTFKIEPSVKKVIIKAVPSVSANVNGAEKQYSFEIPVRPEAEFSFEDLPVGEDGTPLSNKTELNYSLSTKENCSVRVVSGVDTLANESGIKAGEEKNFSVKIEEGVNDYLFYVIDTNDNMFSIPYKVVRDTVAPVLQFDSDYNQIQTALESLEMSGKVADYATFTCNGKNVKVEGDNTFKFSYELKEGLNEIDFVATDLAGNVSEYIAVVSRVIPKDNSWILKLIGGIGLAVGAFLYFRRFFKEKGKANRPEKAAKTAEAGEDKPRKKESNLGLKKGFVKEIIDLAIPIVVLVILLKFIFCIGPIASGSMEPTLKTGDSGIYNRLAYIGDKEVNRGDIIVFYSREFNETIGKRVIGLPGDEIKFKDGYVFINGQYVDESDYIPADVETNCSKTFKVPAGCYFLLGDNRENSNDSRYWANPYISKKDIIGKYIASFPFSIEQDILHII